MKKLIKIILLFIICLSSFTACKGPSARSANNDFNLISKWQSLNDPDFVVEFTSDNKYFIYREHKLVINLDYNIKRFKNDRFDFTLSLNDDNVPILGNIDIVTPNRIRIFEYKDHNMLRWADEFHRTNDLDSYWKIHRELDKLKD